MNITQRHTIKILSGNDPMERGLKIFGFIQESTVVEQSPPILPSVLQFPWNNLEPYMSPTLSTSHWQYTTTATALLFLHHTTQTTPQCYCIQYNHNETSDDFKSHCSRFNYATNNWQWLVGKIWLFHITWHGCAVFFYLGEVNISWTKWWQGLKCVVRGEVRQEQWP